MDTKAVKLLLERFGVLMEENQVLHKRIEELEEQIKKLSTKKTSKNSSNPPSQDKGKVERTQSLRKSSGLSSGGQPGHKGSTLELTSKPDVIVKHKSENCQKCGKELSDKAGRLSKFYQVVDIPEMKPIWTEHQDIETKCDCGHRNREELPGRGVNYGARVKAFISYLSVQHYTPVRRIAEILEEIYGLKMSEGTIVNILKEVGNQSTPIYEQLRKEVEKSEVVGSDETGFRVNGELYWVWTWQSEDATFLDVNKSRGRQTVEKNYPEGFERSVLVHDRLAAQTNTKAGEHQFCMAHILRELKYIQEIASENVWARELESLIRETISEGKELGDDYKERIQMKSEAEEALKKILEYPPQGEVAERLQKALRKNEDKLWQYIENEKVPATNNASERAIRNIRVKQKVSTSMRTVLGAEIFCKLRSIAETCKKRKTSFFQALKLLTVQLG